MKYICFKTLLFIIFLLPLYLWAQPKYMVVPAELESYVPSSLIQDIYTGRTSLKHLVENPARSGRVWAVYSDRANNRLFDEAGWENEDVLNFMERVVVKEVKESGSETWLNVYSPVLTREGQPTRNHVNRGWVKANNLILSNFSLLNEQSIPRKAMALYSLEHHDINVKAEDMQYYYYQEPNERTTARVAQRFRIFYVLKEEGPWVLLSSSDRLAGDYARDALGWMPRRNITPWDHRVCYEFSSQPVAVNQYKKEDVFVFSDGNALTNFMNEGLSPHRGYLLKRQNLSTERQHPRIMRMPILNHIDDFGSWNKKQVVTINSLEGIDDKGRVEIEEMLQKLQDRRKQVNILFVLDATQSMRQYIPRVTQSIIRVIQNQNLTDSQTELRFGLAVYRDYPDEANDQLFEIQPLTSNHIAVIEKIRSLWIGSIARPMPEAKYHGLIQGIERAGFDASNSNVVVLVGDCGNHRNDPRGYAKEKVIETLTKHNVNLITFQVIYGNHESYRDFNWDIQDFLRGIALNQVHDKSKVRLEQSSFENTYQLVYPGIIEENRSLFPFGRFTHASLNEAMDPMVMEDNIVDALQQYFLTVDNSLTIFQNALEGVHVGDSEFEEWLRQQCERDGLSSNRCQELIDNLRRLGEVTARGYLSTRYPGKSEEAFQPVVFMSESEREQIIRMLQILTQGDLPLTPRKKALQEALLAQTERMLGEVSSDIILNMTMDEIWNVILAVPFTGRSEIRNMPLRRISQLEDELFRRFYIDFERKANNFIRTDYRTSQFKLGDTNYFWIPLEDIPGNE